MTLPSEEACEPKIFCLGLNKTGTTTLGECLERLGFGPAVHHFEAGDGWSELCAFLGVDEPDSPLPYRNRQTYDGQAEPQLSGF